MYGRWATQSGSIGVDSPIVRTATGRPGYLIASRIIIWGACSNYGSLGCNLNSHTAYTLQPNPLNINRVRPSHPPTESVHAALGYINVSRTGCPAPHINLVIGMLRTSPNTLPFSKYCRRESQVRYTASQTPVEAILPLPKGRIGTSSLGRWQQVSIFSSPSSWPSSSLNCTAVSLRPAQFSSQSPRTALGQSSACHAFQEGSIYSD
jgi:hypothetical protein